MCCDFDLCVKDVIILEWNVSYVLQISLYFPAMSNQFFFFPPAFVKSDRPAKFPNLQIKYVRGLDPIIKLMDKDGNVQDVSNSVFCTAL
jgi:hypothetical protein